MLALNKAMSTSLILIKYLRALACSLFTLPGLSDRTFLPGNGATELNTNEVFPLDWCPMATFNQHVAIFAVQCANQ